MYYNPLITLSHNCFFNFVVSNRGAGKSFSTLKMAVNNYLKNKKEFVYIRRTKVEIDNVKGNLFRALEHEGIIEKNEFFILGDIIYHKVQISEKKEEINIAGYCLALSKVRQFKSVAYPNVDLIIFDEFIDENNKYIKNECENLLSIIETVARLRTIKVILLGNLITKYNPYFLYFNIDFNPDREFTKYKDKGVLIHSFKSTEFTNKKKETPFAKLIQGTEYGMFMLDNKNIIDKDDFIRKYKGPRKTPQINLIFEDLKMTIYEVFDHKSLEAFLYITPEHNKNSFFNINMDEELRENYKNLKRRNPVTHFLNRFARKGQIYFENGLVKQKIQELIKVIH